MTSMALFYVIWLVVGYLLTMGKSSEEGRTWSFCGLLCLAVFEYQTRILNVDYLAPIDPKGKNVEDWMNEVEGGMREAVHKVMYDALVQYLEVPRDQWTLKK